MTDNAGVTGDRRHTLFDYNHMLLSGAAGGAGFFFTLIGKTWPYLLILAALKYGIPYWMRGSERRRLAGIGIADIDALDGKRFEIYLEVRFAERGYRVERTPYQGDWGADLILEKDGARTAVQAKRWKKNVGVRAVQEATAAKGKYRCDRALVITNSHFTRAAVELAAANAVELWDRKKLLAELVAIQPGDLPGAATAAAPASQTVTPTRQPTPKQVLLTDLPTVGAANSATVATAPAACAICGKALTPKVEAYCRANPARFQSRLLCYDHQR